MIDDDPDGDKLIYELSKLPEVAYQRRRKDAARELGMLVTTLDKIIKNARTQAEEDATALPHWNVEPSAEAVNGAELLDNVRKTFCRYIVLPKGADTALALWVLHAWTFEAGDVSPFMVLVSPTKRCGKTSALIILYYLTPRSELASNITPSATFRYIEDVHPTLLIDEADSFVKDNEEMRGVLNSGHTKAAANVIRNVEVKGEHKARRFSTWAPKAIATIRTLADTLEDRAVIVTLQRKAPNAKVERLRKRDCKEFATLRSQAARWANDNVEKLTDPDPNIPEVLNDRAADNWRPLLAIADLAGSEWPKWAREAACLLSGEGPDSATNVDLLAHIKDAFGELDVMTSADLVGKLAADPERPWAEWNRGKPITQKQLATLLKAFVITSETVHQSGRSDAKGYKKARFVDAWSVYCPGQNHPRGPEVRFETSKRPKADEMDITGDFRNVQKGSPDGSKNGNLSHRHAGLDAWTDQGPENGAPRNIDQENGDVSHRAGDNGMRRCDHCGRPERSVEPLSSYDWEGREILLHTRCEAPWFDSEVGRAQLTTGTTLT
jgi:putative DNA primase/helicase